MHQIDYVVGVYENHRKRLERLPDFFLEGADVVELGPGRSLALGLLLLGKGARSYTGIDAECLVDGLQSARVYRDLRDYLEREGAAKDVDLEAIDSQLRCVGPSERLRSLLVSPDGRLPLDDSSVDLVLSQAVFEHVHDVEGSFREIHRVLRPGCLTSHEIDLRDHHHAEPFDFLRYSDRLWQWMTSESFAWTNRLRISDYLEAAEGAGLEPIGLEATVQPTRRLPTAALATQFKSYSDHDLSCSGFHLVARRSERHT